MAQDKRIGMARQLAVNLACGRSLAEQIEHIERFGSHGANPALRAGTLAAHGVARPRDKAGVAVVFGCNRPYTTPYLVSDALTLLDHLGVAYTWLDKEYCCGWPLLFQTEGKDQERMRQASRDYLGRNLEAARAKGAKTLAYCCAACVYAAVQAFPDAPGDHRYILDLLLDHLGERPLGVSPMTVGYFPGCHAANRWLFPGTDLPWDRYRSYCGRIEGLTLVDMPDALCCKLHADKVIAEAERLGLDAIVCPCSGCGARLSVAGRGKMRVMQYPELLLMGLGIDPLRR